MSEKPPKLVTTVEELRAELAVARQQGLKIGFVPTMGALHEGHLSLVRAAKSECAWTVVSIYVNPAQFGPHEDFARYPRSLTADLELLKACGVEVVFAPTDAEMYRPGHATWVEVGAEAEPLEGRFRPGHFRGVATIVLKLFNIVQPDVAYFGQKDYQQALVIRRMVADLNVPITIRVYPTVREPDGLALSSRNRYLSESGRRQATVLWRSLRLAAELIERGENRAEVIQARMQEMISSVSGAQIDYVALVHPDTLQPVENVSGPVLAALAVRIEGTRLIDNELIRPQKIR